MCQYVRVYMCVRIRKCAYIWARACACVPARMCAMRACVGGMGGLARLCVYHFAHFRAWVYAFVRGCVCVCVYVSNNDAGVRLEHMF